MSSFVPAVILSPFSSEDFRNERRSLKRGVQGLWLAFSYLFGAGLAAALGATLQNVGEIRAVPEWDNLALHPVALEGVVTHVDPARNLLVLQDGTGAIGLELGDAKIEATPGQRVRLSAEQSWPFLPDLPRYPHRPSRSESVTVFESVPNSGTEFYVARFRGLIHPPATGLYRFAIASDDSSRLLLGRDERPASRREIARVSSYTRQRDWRRTNAQRSEPILLNAGQAYYIEAVHQQAGGVDHLSVAWEGPGLPLEVVDGRYLSPWSSTALSGGTILREASGADALRGSVLREVWDNVTVNDPDVLLAPRRLDSVLSVRGVSAQVIGSDRMPEPVEARPGEAIVAHENFRWCMVEGTVAFVAGDGERLTMELTDRGQRIRATALGWSQGIPGNLRGRRVRVIGVGEALQVGGEIVLAQIWMRPASGIILTEQTPEPDFSRLTTIAELSYEDAAMFRDSAVRFVGKVVRRDRGRITISDGGTFAASTSVDGKSWKTLGTPIEGAMPDNVYVGIAVNSRVPNGVSRARFTDVSGLSRAAKVVDIGQPAIAGRCTIDGNAYVVDGVGSDIWDTPDQFTFVYEPLAGSGSIVARLESFSPADPAARAGLMIRESLDPDAQFVDLVNTMESGVRSTSMQWRWRTSGSSTRSLNDFSPQASLPLWLKLERRFNTITAVSAKATQVVEGDSVEVAGYVSNVDGRPTITGASISKHRAFEDNTSSRDWRPMVKIARLGDGQRRWNGMDFFRFRGVVTFCGEVLGRRYWAVQDETAGTLVTGRKPSELFAVRPGSYVEMVSNPGWFPPTNALLADNLFLLGEAAFPEPVRHPAEILLPKRGEGTWIELEGIVRSVAETGLIELKSRGEIFSVSISGAKKERLSDLIDAGVRIRGVIVYPNERERLLLVPSSDHLEIAEPPPRDAFAAPLESLQSFSAETLLNRSRHRTRLRAVVTHSDGGVLYVQDDSGGARVECGGAVPAEVGSVVEVAGFPDWAENESVVFRHALVRVVERGAPVKPVEIAPADAASGRAVGRLIRVRAVVAKTLGGGDDAPLELEADQRVFRVFAPGLREALGAIPEGSVVEVTGVNVKEAGLLQWINGSSQSSSILPLKLLLRSPADVAVIHKPSWWVVKRALIVISLVGLVALVVSVWIHTLRQRVRQRTAELDATMKKLEEEARMSATLAERDRLAGEIHDSLEQGLNGLILQLEGTANLESCPPEIRSGLALACNMASFSRTEVQYAVWELQSPLLEDSELPVAVEKIMRQITPQTVNGVVTVTGTPRRLPSVVEHHLLRVAQEAVNNTVKHAKARNVRIEISYGPKDVLLAIADDGCGFTPEAVRPGGLGHFGLRSLRSRVGKIRATLEIQSSPGKGTTVSVRVPITD
jgi:signal transduction histidine kinase